MKTFYDDYYEITFLYYEVGDVVVLEGDWIPETGEILDGETVTVVDVLTPSKSEHSRYRVENEEGRRYVVFDFNIMRLVLPGTPLHLYWHPDEKAYIDPGTKYIYEDGSQIVDMIESDDWQVFFMGDWFVRCEKCNTPIFHDQKDFLFRTCGLCTEDAKRNLESWWNGRE